MNFLQIKNLTKKYKINNQEHVILNNINYDFPPSGLIFIYGKSGCGKSTLLNLILGIDKPDSGDVYFHNKSLKDFSSDEKYQYFKSNISILFQHYNLLENLSAIENVKLGALLDDNVDSNIDTLFNRFNLVYLKNKKVKYLSGGEKQRISFLRAISKNPDIILADEPTGAIPKHTAIDLLNYLKDFSQDKLVIVVSHNFELLKSYADIILEINNGNINEVLNKNTIKNQLKCFNNKTKINHNLLSLKPVLLTRLKEDKLKNILIVISTFLAFSFILFSVGFINGVNISTEENIKDTLLYNFATISKETYQRIESSSLLLTRQVRPSKEELSTILPNNVEIKENLSYFINPLSVIIYQEKIIDETYVYPYFLNNSSSQKHLEFDEPIGADNSLFVNDMFLEKLNISKEEVIGKKINISNTIDIQNKDVANNKTINDLASFNLEFVVCGVIDEFSFLNYPKVYYSYDYLYNFLSSYYLENHSSYFNREYSCLDLIVNSRDDSQFNMFSYWLNLIDITPEELNEIINEYALDHEALSLNSEYLTIKDSYSSLMNLFAESFFIFTILSFILVNIIISLTVLSSFLLNKKENAILLILGVSYRKIFLIYFISTLILITTSLFLSFLLYKPIELFLNAIIFHFSNLENMIIVPFFTCFKIPLLLPFIITIISVFVIFVSLCLVFHFSSKISIKEELMDE